MRTLLFLMLFLGGISWGHSQEKYVITGNLGDLKQDTFLLVTPQLNGQVQTLGVSVLRDGIIRFEGMVPTPMLASIMTSDGQGTIPFMLENTNYSVYIGKDRIKVEGGIEQEVFNRYSDLQREAKLQQMKLQADMKSAYEDANEMRVHALSEQIQKSAESIRKRQMELVREYPNTCTAAYIVLVGGMQGDPAELEDWYGLLGEFAKNSLYGKMVGGRLAELAKVKEGQIAPDFVILSPEDKPISLYEVKAKVKLLDFWASWCGPCRAEAPKLLRLYKKYKTKGLEIVGVSLDEKKAAWVNALAQDALPWVNGIDAKGKVAGLYGVGNIPHTLLLDENNRIVAKNLHGKALEKKIEELIDK